jgi:hypothetical protein
MADFSSAILVLDLEANVMLLTKTRQITRTSELAQMKMV